MMLYDGSKPNWSLSGVLEKFPHCTLLPIVNDFTFFLNGKQFYYYGEKTQNSIDPKMIKIEQIWINP